MFNKINRNQSEEIIVPHLNTLIYKLNEIKYHIKDYNHCKVVNSFLSVQMMAASAWLTFRKTQTSWHLKMLGQC